MEAQATAKYVRMTPRKVRFVMDTIRGKYADEALALLKFTSNHAAADIAKVLRSAMANAENNFGLDPDSLRIARCWVDVGPTLKRVQPRAQGRAYRILKRTSHITVVVEEAPPRPSKPKPQKKQRQPLRAALVAPGAAAPGAVAPVAPAEEERVETAVAPVSTEVTAGEAAPTDATASA
jgi:large subunit ribosomal protein L22